MRFGMPIRFPNVPVLVSFLLIVAPAAGMVAAADVAPASRPAGHLSSTMAVLPDNRLVAPAGRTILTGVLPLGLSLSPDEHHLLLSEDSAGQNLLQNVELPSGKIVQSLPVDGELFLGVAYDRNGSHAYAAGGGSGKIFRYRIDAQGLLRAQAPLTPGGFPGGMTYLSESGTLLSADNLGGQLKVISPQGGAEAVSIGDHPLNVVIGYGAHRAYVTDSGSNQVSVLRLQQGSAPQPLDPINVGSYPDAMVLSHDGHTLYVANANDDSISVISTASAQVTRTFSIRPASAAPGSAPDALAISPDDQTLYVANGGENDVAVVQAQTGAVEGLIPTGWWPSALALSHDGRTLYIASAKGLGFTPNPYLFVNDQRQQGQYVGSGIQGALSIVPVPTSGALQQLTAQAQSQAQVGTLEGSPPVGNPIPAVSGGPTPFRHVIVIDKENRSYDQVFGDLPQGNGDPNLVLFGRRITPNLHALAARFGLLDNTYANGEVSADGHQWLDGAYATTYVQQSWPEEYGRLSVRPIDFGIAPISYPPSGYIFNDAATHHISYRTYGEQFNAGGLNFLFLGHADLSFPGFNLLVQDQARADEWQREFTGFVQNGNMPQLQYVWLPRDHTTGSLFGQNTPQAQVADNDLATGRIVDAVSHSRYWKDTLIFVIEDDAQNGPDHVDGHRTEALVISAYNRVGAVIHTHYDQLSILRTLELILGMPPLSQFDARALPMYDVFRSDGVVDARPYTAAPAAVSLRQTNLATAPFSRISSGLDFSGPDLAPAATLNRILWAVVRGPSTAYPTLTAPHTGSQPLGD